MNEQMPSTQLANRFRGFYPVVVDVETGGFNSTTDALLEVAAVLLDIDENENLYRKQTLSASIHPFEGANLEPSSLAINGINPFHPERSALPEKEALNSIFKPIRAAMKSSKCTRAILVGHNSYFDLSFINAAVARTGVKNNPFHPFSSLDTVTLGAMASGQTVLSRITEALGMQWDTTRAHCATYDAEMTADIFCMIMNKCKERAVTKI